MYTAHFGIPILSAVWHFVGFWAFTGIGWRLFHDAMIGCYTSSGLGLWELFKGEQLQSSSKETWNFVTYF